MALVTNPFHWFGSDGGGEVNVFAFWNNGSMELGAQGLATTISFSEIGFLLFPSCDMTEKKMKVAHHPQKIPNQNFLLVPCHDFDL